jgi:hypothetical protein
VWKNPKVVIFRKVGRLSANMKFTYNNVTLEIVSKFTYLGLVYTPGGSMSEAQQTLAGQAGKAVYKLDKCKNLFYSTAQKYGAFIRLGF